MADPLAPHDIARRTFDIARRGYEQQEVRGFLHEVSALLERLTRSEKELRERAERAEARLGVAEQPDEAVLLEVLGAETTRVLTSAHEAAAEIRSKAEASAERIIAEATTEAADMRGAAAGEVEALVARTTAESESILEAARTVLERRSADAEEAASRIVSEAQEQAQAVRDEGQAALALARQEGEAALDAARQQGREMVAEAQAVRERVLRDLAVRRKRARQQVEKLNAGRERLLQAYDLVRRTIDEATNELNVSLTDARVAANAAARRIEEEPDTTLEQLDEEVAAAGLADLPIAELEPDVDDDEDDHDDGSGPLSGEVPAVVVVGEPDEPAEATPPEPEPLAPLDDRRGRKSRRKKGFEGLPPSELTVVEPPSPHEGVRILAEPPPAADTDPADAVDSPDTSITPDAAAPPGDTSTGQTSVVDTPAPDGGMGVEEAPAPSPDHSAEPPLVAEPDTGSTTAEDVFARLREQSDAAVTADEEVDPGETAPVPDEVVATSAHVTTAVAAGADEAAEDDSTEPSSAASPSEEASEDDSTEPSSAASPFTVRAAAVAPLEKELRRRLKRALADEQNEVLDLLRRAKPKGVDDLLPDVDGHAARWADASSATLGEAAAAGAAINGGTASSVADLSDELARSLTGPLRERIDRSFVASDGNLDDIADRVRALYREWKGQRLSEASEHFASAAYARGMFDGIDAGAKVQWVVDPSVGACPDCDDNVLAGAIPKGDDFPTGNPCAPAHPGCHCLVLAAPS